MVSSAKTIFASISAAIIVLMIPGAVRSSLAATKPAGRTMVVLKHTRLWKNSQITCFSVTVHQHMCVNTLNVTES